MTKKRGVKPKYKDGIKTEKIHPLIPSNKKKQILKAIDEIVEKDRNY